MPGSKEDPHVQPRPHLATPSTASRRRRAVALAGVLIAVLVMAGLAPAPAHARAGVPKVGGVTAAGQDWVNAKLKVRWTKISGAKYQVRWATSTARLPKAKIYASTTNAATSPALSRCVPWYAQVRAVKSGKLGSWSAARRVRFTTGKPGVPALNYSTASQTSESAAQVRWTGAPYVARYRLDWSAAPHGLWKGFAHNYTPWLNAKSRGTSIKLPAKAVAKDRFIAPQYGNPVFAQLQYDNGCSATPRKTAYVPVFAKPRTPGPGDLVSIGSYNLEGTPSAGPKVDNLGHNIAEHNLDVVALQEASGVSATALIARLEDLDSQVQWDHYGVGAQQIIWRTDKWMSVPGSKTEFGEAVGDKNAATPIRTPAIRLTPVGVDAPERKDIFVVSVHLEDQINFVKTATVHARKKAAHQAATSLLASIADANPEANGVPTLVAGDLKGIFIEPGAPSGSSLCDESSNNGCVGEGQPTFVRAGFWDAQTAVTKVGIKYGTVNKHDPTPPASTSGIGGRADFVLARGAGAFTYYENVHKTYGDASSSQQSDHNLIVARLVIPHAGIKP